MSNPLKTKVALLLTQEHARRVLEFQETEKLEAAKARGALTFVSVIKDRLGKESERIKKQETDGDIPVEERNIRIDVMRNVGCIVESLLDTVRLSGAGHSMAAAALGNVVKVLQKEGKAIIDAHNAAEQVNRGRPEEDFGRPDLTAAEDIQQRREQAKRDKEAKALGDKSTQSVASKAHANGVRRKASILNKSAKKKVKRKVASGRVDVTHS